MLSTARAQTSPRTLESTRPFQTIGPSNNSNNRENSNNSHFSNDSSNQYAGYSTLPSNAGADETLITIPRSGPRQQRNLWSACCGRRGPQRGIDPVLQYVGQQQGTHVQESTFKYVGEGAGDHRLGFEEEHEGKRKFPWCLGCCCMAMLVCGVPLLAWL